MVIFVVWIKFEIKCKDFFNFKLFKAGSAEMLQLMFNNGLKFNEMPGSLLQDAICPDLGKSRLHRAELVKTLFKNGATLSLENDGGAELLKCAVAYGMYA